MPEFQLNGVQEPAYQALDSFTQGYIQGLFFTEEEPGTTREQRVNAKGEVRAAWAKRQEEGQQKDMPGDYGVYDLSPEALAAIIADCERFQKENEALLNEAYELSADGLAYTPERAGHDFWFTRNGHGVGFWSRSWEGHSDIGDRLSERCGWRSKGGFGEVSAYIGDDEKIYLMGG